MPSIWDIVKGGHVIKTMIKWNNQIVYAKRAQRNEL
jgi:hypothetical protein